MKVLASPSWLLSWHQLSHENLILDSIMQNFPSERSYQHYLIRGNNCICHVLEAVFIELSVSPHVFSYFLGPDR